MKIFLISIVIKVALAFDQRHSQCHTLKIMLVQLSIVIYVCSYKLQILRYFFQLNLQNDRFSG